MSDERVICTYLGGVKRDQIHQLKKLYVWDEASQTFIPQPDVFFADPTIAADMGDLIGYLNMQEVEQYPENGSYVTLKEFKPGDPRFTFTSQRSPISATPFRLPMTWSDPWGFAAAAEYESGGTGFAEMTISVAPGDMTGQISAGGSNLTIDFKMGEGIYQPGALVHANHRMASGNAPRGTGFSVEFPKP